MANAPGRRFGRWRAAHLRLGARGERLAARLLRDRGMEILGRNYRGPHGELDIIARDGAMVCFVEVKTRHRVHWARPAHAVTRAKKERIIRTARRYLRQLGHPPVAYRFDIVEIVFAGRRLVEARYWPAEFSSRDLTTGPDQAGAILW